MELFAKILRCFVLAAVLAGARNASAALAVNGAAAAPGASGEGWSRSATALVLAGPGPFEISGTDAADPLHIAVESAATVILAGVEIQAAGVDAAPIEIAAGAEVRLLLAGANRLIADSYFSPAIRVPATARLSIANRDHAAGGALELQSGLAAPDIGESEYTALGDLCFAGSGEIVFEGGTVWCRGGNGEFCVGDAYGRGAVRIGGGSLIAAAAVSPPPRNAAGARLHRVAVAGLAPRAQLDVTRIDGYEGRGIVADAAGAAWLWLADGEYDFWAGETPLRAVVAGADVAAVPREVNPKAGVSVDGVDVSEQHGTGWRYEGGELKLSAGREYAISGTNAAVRIVAAAGSPAAKIRFENVQLEAADAVAAPFPARMEVAFSGAVNLLGGVSGAVEIAGGTAEIGAAAGGLAVWGGSLKIGAAGAVRNARGPVWCVTAAGFAPRAAVAVEGLAQYNTEAIFADEQGRVYLWLPDGDAVFRLGGRTFRAVVGGAAAAAVEVEEPSASSGVCIDGVDAAYGSGPGWSFADGVLTLSARARAHVLSGTNLTGAVKVELAAGAGAVCADLALANPRGAVEVLAGGEPAALELRGVSELAGATGASAVIVPEGAALRIGAAASGGMLKATGGNYAPAIGNAAGNSGGAITFCGGTVIARGGDFAGDVGTAFAPVAAVVRVSGGSVKCCTAGGIKPQAVDAAGRRLYCVGVAGAEPFAPVRVWRLGGYASTGVMADEDGKVWLWLSEGEHVFAAGWREYRAVVSGADVEAQMVREIPRPLVWSAR